MAKCRGSSICCPEGILVKEIITLTELFEFIRTGLKIIHVTENTYRNIRMNWDRKFGFELYRIKLWSIDCIYFFHHTHL